MLARGGDWDEVVRALIAADHVAIACHVNPDGDALGSVLGAALALNKMGKTTFPSWGADALTVPFSYRFLPGAELLVPPRKVPLTGVFLALDCGSRDRLGVLEELAAESPCLINVDHHPGNESFGRLNAVFPNASSTAELVAQLLFDMGVELDRDIATCLYTGLVTDTGRFQHSNCSPDTLRLAADLLSLGVPWTHIAREVYESSPFPFLKLVGRVLDRATLFREERLVSSWVTQKDLVDTGVRLEETGNLIDALRSTRDAEVAVLFKEQPDGIYRVSLRSKGPTSVGALARRRGGGGHELAAGFSASDVHQTLSGLLQELRAS